VKNKEETIFYIIAGTALVWGLSAGIISTTEFTENLLAMFFRSLVTVVGLRMIFHNKWTTVASTLLLVITIAILYFQYHEPMEYLFARVVLYLNGMAQYTPAYGNAISWAITIPIAVFIFIFGFARFNFLLLFGFSATIFGVVLTSGFFRLDMAFYVFVFAMLSYFIKFLNARSLKGFASPFTLYALPLSIFVIALAYNLPKPSYGFTTRAFDTVINRPFDAINDSLYMAFRPRYFSLAQSGFGSGDVRRLGGNVTANDNPVMRVRGSGRFGWRDSVHLTGAILDYYTGYSWENTSLDRKPLSFDGINLELAEVKSLIPTYILAEGDFEEWWEWINEPADFVRIQTGIFNEFYVPHSLEVDILRYRTFSVFQKGILTSIDTPHSLLQNENGTVFAEELLPEHEIYTVFFVNVFRGSEWLSYRGILQDAYDELVRMGIDRYNPPDHFFMDLEGTRVSYPYLLYHHLIPRVEYIHEKYTQLPENFPERVAALARYITENEETDIGKMIRLDDFLKGFEYTLTPGTTPPGRDFVDYFLFDLQRGYCTYFATAFVTMARSLGMPARYIEGFFIPEVGRREFVDVLNRQGHAWAEVYFEGIGWVRFDPTPPDFTQWGQVPQEENETFTPNLDVERFNYSWDEPEDVFDFSGQIAPDSGRDTPSQIVDNNTESMEIPITRVVFEAFVVTTGIFAVVLLARIFSVYLKGRKVNQKSNKDATIEYFFVLLKYLKFFNYQIGDTETAMEFAKRLEKRFGFENEKLVMEDITNIFLKASYSNHDISDKEREILKNAVMTLDKRMQSYISRRKYVYYRYVRKFG